MEVKKFIDIKEVIGSKNPGLLKILPGFVLRYLKRIIHEDKVNFIMTKYEDKAGLDFVECILKEFGAKITVVNSENIPAKGRYILAANHPLGGLDGLAFMHVIGKIRKDILFPVNDLLQNIKNINNLFIPINKHGKNTENIQVIDTAFESTNLILYFPAGLCSRKNKGIICDLEWKNTFIKKSVKFKRDIIPVHINGQNSNFFYNLAKFRKAFGIKANIEMLYLVDEMVKQYNKDIVITVGKTIPYQTFDKRFPINKWAELVKAHTYSLESNSDSIFNIENTYNA